GVWPRGGVWPRIKGLADGAPSEASAETLSLEDRMPHPVQARRKAPIDGGPLHLRTGEKRRMSSHIPAGPWLDGPPARIAASRRSTCSPLKCFLLGRDSSRIRAALNWSPSQSDLPVKPNQPRRALRKVHQRWVARLRSRRAARTSRRASKEGQGRC